LTILYIDISIKSQICKDQTVLVKRKGKKVLKIMMKVYIILIVMNNSILNSIIQYKIRNYY